MFRGEGINLIGSGNSAAHKGHDLKFLGRDQVELVADRKHMGQSLDGAVLLCNRVGTRSPYRSCDHEARA